LEGPFSLGLNAVNKYVEVRAGSAPVAGVFNGGMRVAV
jgi:hypothetical protein